MLSSNGCSGDACPISAKAQTQSADVISLRRSDSDAVAYALIVSGINKSVPETGTSGNGESVGFVFPPTGFVCAGEPMAGSLLPSVADCSRRTVQADSITISRHNMHKICLFMPHVLSRLEFSTVM